MIIEIVQPEEDKINYLERIAGFLTGKVKTTEQLESRFDALLTEFAMAMTTGDKIARYESVGRILRIS